MLKNYKKKSQVFEMVEEELHLLNEIKDVSLSIKKFNKIKYLQSKEYESRDVVRIRKKLHVSQSVLAYLLNASESTVKKWEIGAKKPGGANCRLLQILDKLGVGVLQVN